MAWQRATSSGRSVGASLLMTTYAPSGPKVSCSFLLVAFSVLSTRQVNARQDQRELLRSKLHTLAVATRLRRRERPFFQPLVPDRQTSALIVQQLHAVPPLAGEDEQVARQRILLKLLSDDR